MSGLELSPKQPEWISTLRRESLEHFRNLDMPVFKYGKSLSNRLEGLDVSEENLLPGEEEMSMSCPATVEVMGVWDAALSYPLVKELFMKKAFYPGENKLSAMHGAFWTRATCIVIPENTVLDEPVVIRSRSSSGFIGTHVIVLAGKNSNATVVEIQEGTGRTRSSGVEVFCEDGAHLKYETLQDLDRNTWYLSTKRGILSRDARLDWFTATLGNGNVKTEVSTDLAGQGAETSNLGMFIGDGEQVIDIYNSAIHSAPNTNSDMDNKGIVKGSSKSIYRGLVKIKENASNCDGYQKQDTLILSDGAEADAVPNLEIDNNEVRCSHGATIGRIDEEKMFYMMSRGLSRKDAENEIVRGFLDAMADRASSLEFRRLVRNAIERRLE